jgi:hypothetical protein
VGEHSNRRWTAAADQELLDLVEAGVDWTVIAETLERGYHAVKARAGKLKRERVIGLKAKGK